MNHFNCHTLGDGLVRHGDSHGTYSFFHKTYHSLNEFHVTIGITCCQCYVVWFIIEIGLNSIKSLVGTNADYIEDTTCSIFAEHKEDGLKELFLVLLPDTNTLKQSNVLQYSHQKHDTIDMHHINI